MEADLNLLKQALADQGYSDRTIEAYIGTVRRHLPRICAEAALPWNSPKIQSALEKWAAEYRKAAVEGRVSDSAVRLDVAGLRSFYAFCTARGLFASSPAEHLKGIVVKERLPRPVPPEDVAKLMEAIPVQDGLVFVRDRAIMELFLNGVRNVEVCRLQVQDLRVVPEEHTICARVLGKGKVEGEVFLSPAAAFFTAKYVLVSRGHDTPDGGVTAVLEKFASVQTTLSPGPLFVFGGSGPTRAQLNHMFRTYRARAGLSKSYGPHSLRHTCATEMLNSGVDISVVKEVLRHKNLTQTLQYTKIQRGPKAAASRNLPTYGVLK